MNLKAEMIKMISQIGQQMQAMFATPNFVEQINETPEFKCREEFFKAIKNLGYSDVVAAKMVMAMKIKVSSFDEELVSLFIKENLNPSLEFYSKNYQQMGVLRYLSQDDAMVSLMNTMSFTYEE